MRDSTLTSRPRTHLNSRKKTIGEVKELFDYTGYENSFKTTLTTIAKKNTKNKKQTIK